MGLPEDGTRNSMILPGECEYTRLRHSLGGSNEAIKGAKLARTRGAYTRRTGKMCGRMAGSFQQATSITACMKKLLDEGSQPSHTLIHIWL